MSKFNIKLNGEEMKVLAGYVAVVGRRSRMIKSMEELVRMEVLEKIYERMKRMYRPDKDKYNLKLSAVETYALQKDVLTEMGFSSDPYIGSILFRLEEDLMNQSAREINVYNEF